MLAKATILTPFTPSIPPNNFSNVFLVYNLSNFSLNVAPTPWILVKSFSLLNALTKVLDTFLTSVFSNTFKVSLHFSILFSPFFISALKLVYRSSGYFSNLSLSTFTTAEKASNYFLMTDTGSLTSVDVWINYRSWEVCLCEFTYFLYK